jgi:hypothetical protein
VPPQSGPDPPRARARSEHIWRTHAAAYGEGRLSHAEPPNAEEHLKRRGGDRLGVRDLRAGGRRVQRGRTRHLSRCQWSDLSRYPLTGRSGSRANGAHGESGVRGSASSRRPGDREPLDPIRPGCMRPRSPRPRCRLGAARARLVDVPEQRRRLERETARSYRRTSERGTRVSPHQVPPIWPQGAGFCADNISCVKCRECLGVAGGWLEPPSDRAQGSTTGGGRSPQAPYRRRAAANGQSLALFKISERRLLGVCSRELASDLRIEGVHDLKGGRHERRFPRKPGYPILPVLPLEWPFPAATLSFGTPPRI